MVRVVNDLLVALAILVSLVYALYALGPRAFRARLLAGTGVLLLCVPRFAGLTGLGLRLQATARRLTEGKAGGACGGCDNCGTETAAAGAAEGTGAAEVTGRARLAAGSAMPPEVRVPLSKIGRR